MDLPAFRAATLAALAILLIASSAARADEGAAQVDLGPVATEQPAAAEAPAAPVVDGAVTEEPAEDASTADGATPAELPEAGPAEEEIPQESVEAPAPASPATVPISEPGGPVPITDSEAPDLGAGHEPGKPGEQAPPPAAAPSGTSPALPHADSRPPGGLLPSVTYELRQVRRQIDDLRRSVDAGAPPPPTRIVRLRTTLERIAPALFALEARLGAAGRLSPRVRELLRRARIHLSGARHSAARLIASLRRSGESGPELRLLLRELERFQVLSAALATTLRTELGAMPAPELRPSAAHLEQAPATSPALAVTAPPEHRAGPAAGTSRADEGSAPPSPWFSAPAAAFASAGGAFFAGGIAGLAMLLIGLAPPLLRTRLLPPPERRHTVLLLAPLERPG